MTELSPFSGTIGALGFWMMVAIITVASIMVPLLKQRESQRTLRSLVEKGQHLPPEVLAELIEQAKGSDYHTAMSRDPVKATWAMLFPGIVLICMGPGIAMVGYFLSLAKGHTAYPVYGGACFLASIGVAMVTYVMITLRALKAKGDTAA